MQDIGAAAIVIISGIITLAIIAVIVSQKAQTGQVIQASGTALAGLIKEAVAPVTGFGTSGAIGGANPSSL